MAHEKQGIGRGPLRPRIAAWRCSTVGTEASHVTTGIHQPQTPEGAKVPKQQHALPNEDEMGPRVNALHGEVRIARK